MLFHPPAVRKRKSMQAQVGKPAPDFKLKSTKNATSRNDLGFAISLSDYRGKWLVFFFYPLDFTFVCPTEILAFVDRIEDFKKRQTEVIGVSVDSQFTHHAWAQVDRKDGGIKGLNYPLLADLNKNIARSYG